MPIMTTNLQRTLDKRSDGMEELLSFIDHHSRGGWGDLDDEDKRGNDLFICFGCERQSNVLIWWLPWRG